MASALPKLTICVANDSDTPEGTGIPATGYPLNVASFKAFVLQHLSLGPLLSMELAVCPPYICK